MNKARFSRLGFILAAAGSAVGLGNIWKFPYMTGENGGGAFVLIYLFTITFIGLSLFIAEVLLGKASRNDAVSTFEELAPKNGHIWKYAGFMIFTGLLIFSFYTIVIGWILKYIYVSATSLPLNAKEAGAAFGGMVTTETFTQFAFFNLAFFIIMFILSKGIKQGIEKINLILMPLLIGILLALLLYATTLNGFSQALDFLFVPDWSKVTSTTIIKAVGHAFFTLSVGMGTIMTYAASLNKDANIVRASASVAILDTVIALVAGIVIFSFVFNAGAEPSAGPGLVFISLPTIFSSFGILGNIFSVSFFVALAFAGITSAVSIIEPGVLYMNTRFKISRIKSLVILGFITYGMGTMALLSNVKEYASYVTFGGKGFFDILDFASSSILMPLGGIIIAIFVGYVMQKERVYSLLKDHTNDSIFNLWYFSIKYITPIGVLAIMINELFFK
ncbi:sodium-dependent transporter [Sulfurospirillum arcachonense]|uniref:sodium-dependent transporter n=1 Tax=Sulfurospirillum arcachonense TaxID=57666 RepID=UPI000469D796|nr:sodium-dependent transporter [Sulfurospirillum arcachonense]